VSLSRNLAVKEAQGTLLLFLDDDCEPANGWLDAYLKEAHCNPGFLLLGLVKESTRTQGLLAGYRRAVYECRRSGWAKSVCSGGNFGLARRLFLEVGGFNPTYVVHQDRELCARLVRAGVNSLIVACGVVDHIDYPSWRRFLRGRVAAGVVSSLHWIEAGECLQTMSVQGSVGLSVSRFAARYGFALASIALLSTALFALGRFWGVIKFCTKAALDTRESTPGLFPGDTKSGKAGQAVN
jgi:hypothetical protein